MLEIRSLTKIYKTKKRSRCRALDNVNLSLPSKGLVFVLGKSGSGKSTLLNLIGGLDSITSGRIKVDGNDISYFKEKDFCNYRNTHIGFIFQDYHLIDELTVYQNIALSLNLRKIKDKGLVSSALEKVDLAGYEDRYPTELSGGERQRVAIARAIVKQPRIILADEPTGNLDTNTANAIIKFLKEYSKECLILIVSHNINDANDYADRIIELKDGRVISDKTRNPEFLDVMSYKDGKLIYPQGLSLSDSDIDFINKHYTGKLVKKTDKFLPTPQIEKTSEKVKILKKGLSPWKSFVLSLKFLKNKVLTIWVSAFMVAMVMVIMSLAQTIMAFDASSVIVSEMNSAQYDSLLASKLPEEGSVTNINGKSPYLIKIDDSDIQSFYDVGYKGKIYKAYTNNLFIDDSYVTRGKSSTVFKNSLYVSQTLATLAIDEAFLADKFGEVEYVAKRNVLQPNGLIITDYVADAILAKNSLYFGKSYEHLIQSGYTISGWQTDVLIINGIIKTDYKEKHKALFDTVSEMKKFDISDLINSIEFRNFSTDVYGYLGYSYILNPDFEKEYLAAESWRFPLFYNFVFGDAVSYNQLYQYIRSAKDNGTKLYKPETGSSLRYTATPPEIPEGAKYIRISYHSSIIAAINKEVYGVSDRDYPMLAFDGGEPVGKEMFENMQGYTLNSVGKTISRNDKKYFASDYIEIPDGAEITAITALSPKESAYFSFYDADKNYIHSEIANTYEKLEDSTILLPPAIYSQIFAQQVDKMGENWESTFVPHKVKLSHFHYWDSEMKDPLFEKEVTVGINTAENMIVVSEDIFSLVYKDSFFPYALYFDGMEGLGSVLDHAGAINYQPQSYFIEGIHTMTQAVDVFIPIFELIAIFLCIAVILVLISFSSKMINSKLHEIGIMKALGTKNNSIGVIFGIQILLVAILTSILATLGYYLFIDVANDVLVSSLARLAPNRIVLDLGFLKYNVDIAIKNCILIFILATVAMIVPMVKIKFIKPVKIIKAKE